jgi:AhpD family alkylhydroperoxidase
MRGWSPLEAAMSRQIRRLRPLPRLALPREAQEVTAQIARDFGAFVPPFALHAAAPAVLAACWTMLREALVTVRVDRRRKEVVASAVSRANACTYCVDAHTAALHALGAPAAADALAAPDGGVAAGDPLAALAGWAAATGTADHPALRPPPFTPAEAPELVAIACCFHYVNRMVAIFLAPSPLPFASTRLKQLARRALKPLLAGRLRRTLAPGDALAFLPAAPLPADLAWCAPQPTLAAAFARAATAFDAAGAEALTPPVRALVATRVAAWRGAPPGLGRGWVEDAVAALAAADRPAARLTLLAAFAPFQVDDALVDAVRAVGADDRGLVAATAWASFTTARRIAGWLA